VARRLVLGLGNPGPEHEGTRHNVGFRVVDALAASEGRPWLLRGRALVVRGERDGSAFVLAKPQTYMNISGRAARDLVVELGEQVALLVVCDDFHLPLGRLRCRTTGSDGGQRGLASVIDALEGRSVPRLRLGIGEPGRQPAEEYVLRRFGRGEQAEVDDMVGRAAEAVGAWLGHGDLDQLMNAVNGPISA
jgi:PTH1 family peptidyl-tRNA hydrolase